MEREKGGIKALQEQLQSGKVSLAPKPFFWVLLISLLWVLIARECGWVGLMRVRELAECSQENGGRPASDLDTSVVSGRSNASRNSVARLGGSLVHSSSSTGVRDFFAP